MDMPEGWKRIETRVKQGYENHNSDKDLAKLIYVVKEMAEALELIVKPIENSPFNIPMVDGEFVLKRIYPVLMKFKEWK